MPDFSGWLDISYLVANVATAGGIVVALAVWIGDRRQARLQREDAAYEASKSQYRDFLRLCLDRPDLPLYDMDHERYQALPPVDQKRVWIGLELLTGMFETAHFLYNRERRRGRWWGWGAAITDDFRQRQWEGWAQYIELYASSRLYQEHWEEWLDTQYDAEFLEYMNGVVSGMRRRQIAEDVLSVDA